MKELAIILAAGLGSRLRPITDTVPKPLVCIDGTPIIETIINALATRGVKEYIIVTGYLRDQFDYLKKKYDGVRLVFNNEYITSNNLSSLFIVEELLESIEESVFICDADLYVSDESVFLSDLDQSCYFGWMQKGYFDDWALDTDENGRIIRIGKTGNDSCKMIGIAWLKRTDARILGQLIKEAYSKAGSGNLLWDEVVNDNLDKLDLRIHEIRQDQITEIDTIEDLSRVNRML